MIALPNAHVNTSSRIGQPQESRAYERGFYEASADRDFDPSYHGYARGSKQEYDYARGYAEICNVSAAVTVIEAWGPGLYATIPAGPQYLYEDDGNILRHMPTRRP